MSARGMAPILTLCLACGLRADSALDVHAMFEKAAAAMADRKAAGFVEAFDTGMPGFGRLRSQVEALLKTNDAESTIEWRKNEGDDQTRTVQLNWRLEITERNGAAAVTHRRGGGGMQAGEEIGKVAHCLLYAAGFLCASAGGAGMAGGDDGGPGADRSGNRHVRQQRRRSGRQHQ